MLTAEGLTNGLEKKKKCSQNLKEASSAVALGKAICRESHYDSNTCLNTTESFNLWFTPLLVLEGKDRILIFDDSAMHLGYCLDLFNICACDAIFIHRIFFYLKEKILYSCTKTSHLWLEDT